MPFINGGGATFNGGTITRPLVIAPTSGNDVPLLIEASWNAQNTDFLAVENTDTGIRFATVNSLGDFVITPKAGGNARATLPNAATAATLAKGVVANPISSGALATASFVSGTPAQLPITRDVVLVVPCTLNPTAGAAGTVKVELSPDGVTYSELVTVTEPAGVALDGTIIPVSLLVPTGWSVKLTATNATIGTGTYY